MKKSILITGGSGFIGSHLIAKLAADDRYNVIALLRSKSSNERLRPFIKKIKCVYIDKEPIEKVFKTNKIDVILHLATKYIKNHEKPSEVEEMIDSNVRFPSVLCDLANKYGIKYFINSGTFFEYKLGGKKKIKEGDPIAPYNFYSATKLSFSEILKYYCENSEMKAIDFKLFAPFGENDNEKLVIFLIKSLLNGEKIEFSGGEQKWNFTYVADIVKAYILAIEKIKKIDENYLSINLGYDKVSSIRNLAKILEKISGKKLNIKWGAKPYINNEIFYVNCDNGRLKQLLKWKPDYDLKTGLEMTYRFYLGKENNGKKGN